MKKFASVESKIYSATRLFVAFNLTIKYSHNITTTQPFKRPSTGRLETTILESIKYTTRPDSTALCTCYDDLTPIILR